MLSWQLHRMESRIKGLPEIQKRKAQEAFGWLCTNSKGYQGWLTVHRELLAQGNEKNLPVSALLETYVEAAL